MIPSVNPAQMKQMMKKLGIKQEEIDAEEVIIKGEKSYIIRNPEITKINMMGQESLQIAGKLEPYEESTTSEDDIQTIMDQTGCSKEQAQKALEENDGDIAAAILSLKK